ncbi:MAG TPA: HAD family hydrolase [Nitrospiraceae bacterium]|nr:HAD family hydrolase [Nitrospiraceae bacterium]
MKQAVFLDKDGTLIEDVPYNCDGRLIRLMPGVGDGLRRLQAAGYTLIVVSNQPGVAHGFFSTDALGQVETTLGAILEGERVRLDGFYYCPHHPEGRVPAYATACDCRKPSPGLLIQAASDYAIELHASWMIGDILHDVEAGRRAGCRTILIDNGHETEWHLGAYRCPDATAADLASAADIILAQESGTAILKMDGMMARSHRASYEC